VFTLRCTQKLLRRGLVESPDASAEPTTLLSDWYANLLVTRRQHLLLCVSQRTLLPLVAAARDIQQLPQRIESTLASVLAALNIDSAAVARERTAMQAPQIGRTADRRVLGSLNELMFLLQHQLEWHPELTLVEHSLRLADTPMKGVEYASPDLATAALFASTAALDAIRVQAAR
jgi:hypothetical protein